MQPPPLPLPRTFTPPTHPPTQQLQRHPPPRSTPHPLQVLNGGQLSPQISNWIGVLVLLLAAFMNESAIDSLQVGAGDGVR